MKHFVKVFFCMILVITIALAVMGYVLISHNFENALSREKARVLEEYQLLKFQDVYSGYNFYSSDSGSHR